MALHNAIIISPDLVTLHGRISITMLSESDLIALVRFISFWGGIFIFLLIETVNAYRVPTVPRAGRWITNISLAVVNGSLLRFFFSAVTVATAYQVTDGGVLLNMAPLPGWLRVLVILIALDFVIYIWHYANHISPFLWRFHRVHHSDMNMDVSTASRFHVIELSGGALIKLSMIKLLGIDLFSLAIFETLLLTCAQFHHSSLRISPAFEGAFVRLGVPPSMHRIHHSVVITERNANYGTIFSWWDRLFGTFRYDVPQERIVIGMGAYRIPQKLSFWRLLIMPFRKPVR